MGLNGFLDCDLLTEPLERVVLFHFLELHRRVLVNKLIDGKVATAHTDVNLVLLNLDGDTLAPELVNTLRLTHEHDFELGAIGVVVDVLSQSAVSLIVFYRDVNSDPALEIQSILLECLNFCFCVFERLK